MFEVYKNNALMGKINAFDYKFSASTYSHLLSQISWGGHMTIPVGQEVFVTCGSSPIDIKVVLIGYPGTYKNEISLKGFRVTQILTDLGGVRLTFIATDIEVNKMQIPIDLKAISITGPDHVIKPIGSESDTCIS